MALIVPALINWLWQASLLTLAVALAVRVGPRVSASTRERIWWIALAANLALLAAAFSSGPAPSIQGEVVAPRPLIELPPMDRGPMAIAVLWSAWIVIHLVRMTAGAAAVFRAIRQASPLPLHREHADGVPLVLSTAIRHAAVLGWRRPVIALAPETMARLSDREIDQVVRHELAHVRRRDPWALLIQRGVRAVAGFHPAMWWLDRAITLDRERACDDWVLAAGESSKQYSACLLKLIAPRGVSLAPGASLARGDMAKRIRYLLESGRDRSLRGSRTAMIATATVVATLTVLCGSHDLAAYQRSVAQAFGLDIVLAPGGSPSLWTLASPPSAVAPDLKVGPAARPTFPDVDPAFRSGGTQNTSPRVEDDDRPLDASVFDTHVPAPPPQQELRSIEGREVGWNLSAPDATGSPTLDLSREVADDQATGITTPQSPWQVLTGAGKAVGSGGRKAGVGTGRAFSRLGRSVAGIF